MYSIRAIELAVLSSTASGHRNPGGVVCCTDKGLIVASSELPKKFHYRFKLRSANSVEKSLANLPRTSTKAHVWEDSPRMTLKQR